jgi:hypothetical protein
MNNKTIIVALAIMRKSVAFPAFINSAYKTRTFSDF